MSVLYALSHLGLARAAIGFTVIAAAFVALVLSALWNWVKPKEDKP